MPAMQFTTEEAYSGNTSIKKYKNGVLIDEIIISDWALEGYINCLEDEGYKRAYDVDIYRKALEDAQESERIAREAYIRAVTNPLYKK